MPKTTPKPIRIVLADDHPLVRAGVRESLKQIPDAEVVGEASDGQQAIELVKSKRPDVVLLDISMPVLNGLEATERIIKAVPQVRVIILSRHENEEYYWRALKLGASGYVLKNALIAELQTAIQRVAAGEVYLSQQIAQRLRKQLPLQKMATARSPVEQLSLRQREILQLIAEGETTKGIAIVLKLSPKTVEYHRMQVMQRLNIFDIPGLVRFALRNGLISQEG
ncbi:MAG TPA: response regulator transcription factor [Candidatus Acidoferrum sp.]|nr:response regulator transcription factor [Candidatus Acidoferrum sp.]